MQQQPQQPQPTAQPPPAGGDNKPTAMQQLQQYKEQLQTDLVRVEQVVRRPAPRLETGFRLDSGHCKRSRCRRLCPCPGVAGPAQCARRGARACAPVALAPAPPLPPSHPPNRPSLPDRGDGAQIPPGRPQRHCISRQGAGHATPVTTAQNAAPTLPAPCLCPWLTCPPLVVRLIPAQGFEAHLSSKEALRKRMQRSWKTEDRWFSLSSTTSPVVR